MREITFDDFAVLAEAVTGLDAVELATTAHVVARAESALAAPFAQFDEVAMYPGLVTRAAILCSRLLRNHPLPDGNKRVAYLCMIEPIRRNGAEWAPTASEQERVVVIERVAAREIAEVDFAQWVAQQIAGPREPEPRRART